MLAREQKDSEMTMKPMEIGTGYVELDPREQVRTDLRELETLWFGKWTPLPDIQLSAVSSKCLYLFRAKSSYTYAYWSWLGWTIRRAKAADAIGHMAPPTEVLNGPGPSSINGVQLPGPPVGTREKVVPSYQDVPKPFTPNKYTRTIHSLDGRKVPVDVYCVLAAFPTGSAAVDHAVKKQLAPGQRGTKSRLQDLKEAYASLGRAIELEEGQDASP